MASDQILQTLEKRLMFNLKFKIQY